MGRCSRRIRSQWRSSSLLFQQLAQVVKPFAFEDRAKLGIATITIGKIFAVFITARFVTARLSELVVA